MSSLPGVGELKKLQQRYSTGDTKKIKLSIGNKKQGTKLNRIFNKNEIREGNLAINIDESGAEKNSINPELNAYCLAGIFSYLPPVDRLVITRVCKKWRDAVQMTWHDVKKIDIDNLPVAIKKKSVISMELLKNCCQYLTHFKSNLQYFWIPDILENNCKNIVHFDISLCSEFAHNFYEIIGSMPKLKYLKVAVNNNSICYSLVKRLVEILPTEIEEIHFLERDVPNNEFSPTAPALDKFTNLRCLTLQSFHLITSTIESISLNKNTLIYLDLKGCCFEKKCSKIFSELVNLEHLNLDRVENVNDNMMITEIALNCQKLKYFVYRQDPYPYIPRRIFRKLKYLKNLEHLHFPAVHKAIDGDNSMSDVVESCKKLKHFDVGQGLIFSTSDIEEITKLKHLEYLNLHWTAIDPQSITKIVSNCLELKKLEIRLEYVSEIDIEKLTNLKKLEKLEIHEYDDVTEDLLPKFAINCTNLVELDVSGCSWYATEASLIEFGKLKYLQKLKIDNIREVPNEMFDYFHKLEYLSCYNCPSITDENIIKVLDNCQKLSELNVMRTRITVATLVHAENRQLAYKVLSISVSECIYNAYSEITDEYSLLYSPFLKIKKNY